MSAGEKVVRIAVAGGTGLVGRHVVDAVTAAGAEPVVLARSTGVDLLTGEGLEAALDGVHAVVDVSNVATIRRRVSVAFFTRATRHLLDAGGRTGVRHHVALSIVGVDAVDSGYYAGKRAQEQLLSAAALPATVLRSTQFHEFAGQLLAAMRGPIAPVPRMRTQPVAAREVAAELVALAQGPPLGMAPELAGPEERRMADLVRRLAHARGERRLVVEMPLPGSAARAAAQGALLPIRGGLRGRQTFEEWLATAALGSAPRQRTGPSAPRRTTVELSTDVVDKATSAPAGRPSPNA
jgi:uncharacterized protein YbjT (DUF2867 family)